MHFVQRLLRAREKAGLTVLTLDYVPEQDSALVEQVLATAQRFGFKPYISTPALDKTFLFTLKARRSAQR